MAIIDNDLNYALKLMEFINQKQSTLFIASVFTNLPKYRAYTEENEVAVLVCEEGYAGDGITEFINASGCTIYLSKNKDVDTEKQFFLYKYQSALILYDRIVSIYKAFKNPKPYLAGCSPIEVMGIIPIFEQEACFYFGVLMADYSSQVGKTLYVSFDPFFSPFLFGFENECSAVTDSISMMRIHSVSMMEYLQESLLEIKNCSILGGCVHWADCTEIEEEEAAALIRSMMQQREYYRIIIDFGGLYRMAGGLMKFCTKLYMPMPNNAYEKVRMQIFQRQADRTDISIDESADLISFDGIQMEIWAALAKNDPMGDNGSAAIIEIIKNSSLMELVKVYA